MFLGKRCTLVAQVHAPARQEPTEVIDSARLPCPHRGSRAAIDLTAHQPAQLVRSREESERNQELVSYWLPRCYWCGRGDSNPHALASASPSSTPQSRSHLIRPVFIGRVQ